MSRGRTVPPRVVLDLPPPAHEGYARAMADDERYFLDNPDVTERRRPYVEGEAPAPLPPGTTVLVKRIGWQRVRAFFTPNVEGN